jgi:hypothetical protein
MSHQLLFVPFQGSDGSGAAVILNGVTVYHEEDDDRDYRNPNFSVLEVSKRLGKALGQRHRTIRLKAKELPEDWNFDDVEAVALKKAARLK